MQLKIKDNTDVQNIMISLLNWWIMIPCVNNIIRFGENGNQCHHDHSQLNTQNKQRVSILRFSDRETNLHSVLGVRLYWDTGTGLLFNNDICLRIVLSKNELQFFKNML